MRALRSSLRFQAVQNNVNSTDQSEIHEDSLLPTFNDTVIDPVLLESTIEKSSALGTASPTNEVSNINDSHVSTRRMPTATSIGTSDPFVDFHDDFLTGIRNNMTVKTPALETGIGSDVSPTSWVWKHGKRVIINAK